MASVGRGIPAIVISVRGEVEWARLLKRRAHPLLDFGLDPVEPLVVYRIFETRALAILAVAIVALDRHHRIGADDNLVHGNEADRSEEHTSELQSLMRNSYAVFCLKKKNNNNVRNDQHRHS